jgi:hypothetical protein
MVILIIIKNRLRHSDFIEVLHGDHCNKECENVWICKLVSIIGTRYALLCTCCQKLIGIYSSSVFDELPEFSDMDSSHMNKNLIN